MSLNIVLAVGLDSWLLAAQAPMWRSSGYVVVSAETIVEALDLYEGGDFDLVLLGHAVPGEKRERFISLIRASGARTPIACIAGDPGDHAQFTGSILNSESRALLAGMNHLLAEEAGRWTAFETMSLRSHPLRGSNN